LQHTLTLRSEFRTLQKTVARLRDNLIESTKGAAKSWTRRCQGA
jgi:hypothetical protein